jgi:hypothetical protein
MNLNLATTIGLGIILALSVIFFVITQRRLRDADATIESYQEADDIWAGMVNAAHSRAMNAEDKAASERIGANWARSFADRAMNSAKMALDARDAAYARCRSYATIFGDDPLFYHGVAKKNDDGYDPKTIAVDLDGVILKFDGNWKGSLFFDEPIPGAVEGLQKLRDDGFQIIVYTTRINPLAAGNQGFTAVEQLGMVQAILNLFKIPYDKVSFFKPLAAYYIDDRAIRFTDWKQAVKDIEKLETPKKAPTVKRLK